jgi:hypothetical protein
MKAGVNSKEIVKRIHYNKSYSRYGAPSQGENLSEEIYSTTMLMSYEVFQRWSLA